MRKIIFLLGVLVLSAATVVGQRQIEALTRGTVAVRTGASSVLVSWRWLATDADDVAFNVYRDATKLNTDPITASTNWVDNTSANGTYVVKAVVGGVEQESAEVASVMATNYIEVPLQIPAAGITPASETYTYNANDASVGDVDGDGAYEIILKWDPSNSKDNSQGGYTGNVFLDAYKLNGTRLWRIDLGKNIRAGAHYSPFMVFDLDGDGKAEVACKTAPNTMDGTGSYLKLGPAASDNDATDYRNTNGYILTGPEYLTVFNGQTGAELATVNYNPARGTVNDWGDAYGNRVDRFLACVAYLDGERPSLVMCRGYYTRAVLAAWDWRNGTLSQRWVLDSNTSGNSAYAGQGNHNLSVADVDGDGKDEIVYGSCTINDNGTGLYSTGLGHGDALHVTDHAPGRPGLEVFAPHEESGRGISFRDAKTGAIIWEKKMIGDIGRGAAADVTAAYPGSEFWAAGMGTYNVKGEQISTGAPAMNFLVWWDGDLLRETLDGVKIAKYNVGTLMSAAGCTSNNGTKATPCVQADLWGDWREEVIWRTSDNSNLRIFSTPNSSAYRFRTLMHDPVYRLAVAWQNAGYNQPPHVGFFLGDGMGQAPVQPVVQAKLKWNGSSTKTWTGGTNWKNASGIDVDYADGDDVLFSISGNNSADIDLTGVLLPKRVSVIAPKNYVFGGTGSLAGNMELVKAGSGTLTLKNEYAYSGATYVSDGSLVLNGTLAQSHVKAWSNGSLSGSGNFAGGVSLNGGGMLYVGPVGSADTMTVGNLELAGNSSLVFDLTDDVTGTVKTNDRLVVNGNLTVVGPNVLTVNKLSGDLTAGTYVLATVSGTLTGDLGKIQIEGLAGLVANLEFKDGALMLNVGTYRGASLVWTGGLNSTWDLQTSSNFTNQSVADVFKPGDAVVFDDNGNTAVVLAGELPMGGMAVDATKTYSFVGDGVIAGAGGLTKENTGELKLPKYNTYTGATVVNGGVLNISYLNYGGLPSSIGAAPIASSNWVVNGAVVRYSGASSNTNRGLTVGANGAEIEITLGSTSLMLEGAITGGTLTKTGTGTLVLEGSGKSCDKLVIKAGTVKLYGDAATPGKLVSFEGGTLNCMDDDGSYNTMSWPIEVAAGKIGTINMDSRGYYTGALTGGGTLNVNFPAARADLNGNWSAFTGTINCATNSTSGDCRFGNSLGLPNATVNLGANVYAYHNSNVSTKLGALTGIGILSGSHNWEIGNKNTTFSFGGTITAGSLTKVGTGRMNLTGANSYTGTTIVSNGVLYLGNTSGSATGTGAISVQNGGALSGIGTASGTVSVLNGGFILPGNQSTVGQITIGSSVTFQTGGVLYVDVNASTATSDLLYLSAGSVTLQSATLQVANKGGAYQAGNKFKIINAPVVSGTFTVITPAIPADGLVWDLSELNSGGYLKVASAPTAINDVSLFQNVAVYPNPVRDDLNVDLPESLQAVTLDVFDLLGNKKLTTGAAGGKVVSIHLSELPVGVYMLKISSGNRFVVKKFTKR